MKNIFNSILAIGAAAMIAASCNVENLHTLYTSEGSENNGVTFLQTVLTDTEISAAATSYSLKLGRAVATADQTVALTTSLPADITVPTSANFAAGEYETELKLTFGPTVAVGKTYKGSIKLANKDDFDKNTAIDSVIVTFQKAYSWAPYGKVTLTDDLLAGLFGTENVTWKVDAEKAEGFEVYRLLDPYGEAFPYNEPGDFTPGAKWVIDANDPNAVIFDKTFLGFDWGYGEFNIWPLDYGTMVNKVITWPANGIAINLPTWGSTYANENGAQKIDLNL